MQDPNTQRAGGEEQLERAIGKLGYSAIALNGVIGAGIFALPGIAIARAGAFSPWMFVIGALLILTIVLSFAKAASFVSRTGGPIVYATEAFGPFAGFQSGWLLYISRTSSIAANILLMISYIGWFVPEIVEEPYRSMTLIGVVAILTWLNIAGVRHGMGLIYLMTVLKLLPLSLLLVFGLPHLQLEPILGADLPDPGTLGETTLVLLYAFVGFESAVIPAGEGRNPRRDLPRSLSLTVAVIGVFYFLIQWISVSVAPDLAGAERPLATVAGVVLGATGAMALSIGAVFSIAGNSAASVLSAPRLTYSLALDGRLPAWFARVHPRHHTPHTSVLFYGLITIVLGISGTFVWLAITSTLVRLLMYVICIVSLPGLKKAFPDRDGDFRLPGGYLIPGLALLLCGWLFLSASWQSWLAVAIAIVVGSGLYYWTRRTQ